MPIRPEERARYPENWKESVERRLLRFAMFTDHCWDWTGSKSQGYGRMKLGGVVRYAHRLSLEVAHGRPLGEGLQVDHLCRNRSCIRPSHLEAVTPAENTRRGLVAKLTPAQVAEMRCRRAAGETVVMLGKSFGVHHSSVSRICRHLRYDQEQHQKTRRERIEREGQQRLPGVME